MELTPKQVANVATLARIKVEQDELPDIGKELSSILHWIDQLEAVDVKDIQNYTDCYPESVPERNDEVTDGNCVDEVLANAPEKAHNMFAVPKVVE